MTKVGVLASGRGSNLGALLEQQRLGALGGEVVVVLTNRPDAPVVEVASKYDVPLCTIADPRGQTDASVLLKGHGVELVVLAGYDRILASEFVREWEGRMINIHPSLLPAFGGGLHAVRDALAYGVKATGCTVHFVTEDVDAGPIISQAAVPVLPDDDEARLAKRIREKEHQLLPEAVRAYAEGRLTVVGRRVVIEGSA
ncbi:MAG: phosphoribosylglycinamide formyltransferase [Chloroflexia bacterium]